MIDEEKQLEDMQSTSEDSGSEDPQAQQPSDQHADAGENTDSTMTLDQVTLEDLQGEASASSEQASSTEGRAGSDAAVLKELSQEIEMLKAQLEDRIGQYVRIAADFDNFRKRTQKEREELEEQVKCSTIVEMLPVVDNFERARSQIKPQTDSEMNIHKSYQSVYKQLVECLKRLGVSPMRAEGQEFDPNLHEAVLREPTAEQPEGTVLEELMRGYVLGQRVLRHAMVKVAAPPEDTAAPSGQDGEGAAEG